MLIRKCSGKLFSMQALTRNLGYQTAGAWHALLSAYQLKRLKPILWPGRGNVRIGFSAETGMRQPASEANPLSNEMGRVVRIGIEFNRNSF